MRINIYSGEVVPSGSGTTSSGSNNLQLLLDNDGDLDCIIG